MNYQTFSLAFASVKVFISNFMKNSDKQQLLDPMSTLIKLCLISFCEKGTKISICNNSIYIQNPGLLQGALRWSKGDKREDLHNLYGPIEKALEWYNPNEDKSYKYIYELAIEGLKELQKSYLEDICSNLVAHTISYYINIIDNKIKGDIINNLITDNLSVNNLYQNDNEINQLKSVWTTKEIKIIYHSLIQISEAKKENKELDSYIQSVISILDGKDKQIKDILHKRMTTF